MMVAFVTWLIGLCAFMFGYFIGHAFGYNKGWDSGYDQRINEERQNKER
jgi:hypothetical protein